MITDKEFLELVSDKVVLVGSYGRKQEALDSDLDFYVKQDPVKVENCEIDTSYLPEIIRIIEAFGLARYMSSECIGYITLNVPDWEQMEFSYFFRIPSNEKIFTRSIHEVVLKCARDDKNIPYTQCYEYINDLGELENPIL